MIRRVIVALMTLFPALIFCGFCFFATPDLESWLAARFDGFARSDAFDGVSQIAPLFAVVFSVTSLLGACLVVLCKTPYLLTLAAGPLLAGLVYVVTHGVTDPAWFTLLALLSIGMLVGSPVTAAWAVTSAKRQALRRTMVPDASLLESRVDEAFSSMLDTKLAEFHEWSRGRTLTGCRLVQYCGVQCTGACDVAPANTQSEIKGLLCEGYRVDWTEREGRLYLRVWESDGPEPPWPQVFAEEHLADVDQFLRQAGHLS